MNNMQNAKTIKMNIVILAPIVGIQKVITFCSCSCGTNPVEPDRGRPVLKTQWCEIREGIIREGVASSSMLDRLKIKNLK